MTARDLIRKLRERKGTALSVTLHVLVIGWGLISFSARSLEAPPPEVIPVDISMDNTSKMTAGIKSGQKENPKPLVDKVGEAKPVDDAVGKVDKKEVVTDTSTPDPPPKPVEKPVEKKPDPKPQPKKAESKQADKKPDEKGDDPIADALKADKKKPVPKQAAKTTPQPPKPKERIFNESRIAALLDKRDPSRQAVTGAVINPNAALGTRTGNANAMEASWVSAFSSAVRRCFSPPYNGEDADQFNADIDVQMRPDGTLAAEPTIIAVRGPSKSVATAIAESAKRAIIQCQPYSFLPKEQYATWKYIPMFFDMKID